MTATYYSTQQVARLTKMSWGKVHSLKAKYRERFSDDHCVKVDTDSCLKPLYWTDKGVELIRELDDLESPSRTKNKKIVETKNLITTSKLSKILRIPKDKLLKIIRDNNHCLTLGTDYHQNGKQYYFWAESGVEIVRELVLTTIIDEIA